MNPHHHTKLIAAAIALLFALAATTQAASPFGPNLLPNPGFEETDPGTAPLDWKLSVDKQDAAKLGSVETDTAAGKRALSLDLAAPELRGKKILLQSPVIPCEPGWYLLSFSYRIDFTGVEKPIRLLTVERLLDSSAGTRDDTLSYYYQERPAVSGKWDHTFLVFQIRPGQAGTRLSFAHWSPNQSRFALDAISLRKIDAATLAGPAIEEPFILKGGLAGEPVEDPAASNGRGYRCEEGKHKAGNKIRWSAENTLSPGLYRLRFRLRQEQPSTTDNPIILTASGDNGAALEFVRNTDFKGTTDYETFDLMFFYPFGEGHCINWRYSGSGIYRFDQISAEKVADVPMKEAWDVLAEGVKPQ